MIMVNSFALQKGQTLTERMKFPWLEKSVHGYEIVLFSHTEVIRNPMSYLQKCEANTYVAIKKAEKQTKNSEIWL